MPVVCWGDEAEAASSSSNSFSNKSNCKEGGGAEESLNSRWQRFTHRSLCSFESRTWKRKRNLQSLLLTFLFLRLTQRMQEKEEVQI